MIPFRNGRMRVEETDESGVIVTVPLRRPKWLVPPISWLLPFRESRRVELDALGAEVLDLCNGRWAVETIVTEFARRHALSFREAQLPVVQFLRMLTQRGVIAIVATRAAKGGSNP